MEVNHNKANENIRILITGGSGFLGSALSRHLLAQGYNLCLLLRATSSLSPKLSQSIKNDQKIKVYRFKDFSEIEAAVLDFAPDRIVHTACSYGRKGESFADLYRVNLGYGLALLDSALKLNKKIQFINTGTPLPKSLNAYALTKWQFIEAAEFIANNHREGVHFINIELQHMYGPDDADSKFATFVLHACMKNIDRLPLTLGQQNRDFIHIDDVVLAYECIIKKSSDLDNNISIQLGSGQAPSVREFVEYIHSLCKSNTILDFGAIEYRPGEIMNCQADISLIQSLGWSPTMTWQEGLNKTYLEEGIS